MFKRDRCSEAAEGISGPALHSILKQHFLPDHPGKELDRQRVLRR